MGESYTFIDLFAGIGGIRLGLASSTVRCCGTSRGRPLQEKCTLGGKIEAPIAGSACPCASGWICMPFIELLSSKNRKNGLAASGLLW